MMKKYDVAIIGAGTSGLTARRQIAKKTDNYVLIDDGPLGTTCARVGCMPSKVLIQIANDFHHRKKFLEMGIQGAEALIVDRTAAMKHVRKLRDRFVRGVLEGVSEWKDQHLIPAKASFIDKNTLELTNGEKIKADKVLIATGSRPIIPGPWKEFSDYIIDTDSFFEMEELPKRVAVIGLGVIGLELGQALHRIGVEIVGIGRSRRMAGLTDPDLISYTAKKLEEEMNLDFTGVKGIRKSDNGLIVCSEQGEYEVDALFVTVGRKPNLEKLCLDNLDLELNEQGIPKYNQHTGQIEDTNLYIAGDINAEKTILHEASDEGMIAGYNMVNPSKEFKRRTPLGITFSDPNIAIVGESYSELKARKADFATGEVSFEGQGRSIVKLKEIGLLHIYGEKGSGCILGAELFGPDAEHLAHLIAWSIEQKLTTSDLLSFPFYHPVVEEGLRTAIRKLHSECKVQKTPLELKEV